MASKLNGQGVTDETIINVIPSTQTFHTGDYDYDGDMDALVVTSKNNIYAIKIYSQEKCDNFKCSFK